MTDQTFHPRVRFGIWSDSQVAAEELQGLLAAAGQQAVITKGDRHTPIECLVVLTRRPPTTTEQAVLTNLFNSTTMTIAVEQPDDAPDELEAWPRDVSLRWTGQIKELETLAADLMNLVRPTVLAFTRLPRLLSTDDTIHGTGVTDSREMLVERLTNPVCPRVVRVTTELLNDLLRPRQAENRADYDLRRIAAWSNNEHSRAFVNLRLSRPEDRTVSPLKPLSLDGVINDSRTRPLVLLLGEPSAGKSLQLQYYDAHAALRSLRRQPASIIVPATFYVALADQPARPDISVDWLRQRWSVAVETRNWYDFDMFLGDAGTVLLDGLNEGGLRGLEPEQWMSQWRDVIQELFERGAGKVVVSCRTRDQAVRMNVPRDRQPTSVTILPLVQEEIIAIATERNVVMARQLARAFAKDPGLVELYSSPFALQTFLDSRTSWVATTGARLLGVGLSAAIVREWDHDNSHGRLIPGARASSLETMAKSDQDPWPELEMIPLIRGLSHLAKHLTLPAPPNGQARQAMSPGDTGDFVARAVQRIGGNPVNPHDAVETAKDLHVLRVDGGKILFAHPSLQHLFAAVGCSIEELVELAEQERDRPPAPSIGVPPSEARHRYDELFQFSAQLRGIEVPERLLPVDPVLAARVFITIRREMTDDEVRDRIVTRLCVQLDSVFVPTIRVGILAALGDLDWSLPSVADGARNATMLVPEGTWHLGGRADPARAELNVSSEVRSIELPQFRISRFPVSNAEYATFVQDDGYEDQTLWSAEGWQWRMRQRAHEQFVADWRRRQIRLQQDHPAKTIDLLRRKLATPAGAAALVRFAAMTETEMFEYARAVLARPVTTPRFWHRSALGNRLQPVVGVSWFEANAFCSWLGRRLGSVVRLPSESEWEAACLRSWGLTRTAEIDESRESWFGNTRDAGWQATTPIGAFAARDQARRDLAVELMGNVFEWVFDYYATGDHSRRIVKGGSWRHEHWRAHPAYRGRGDIAAQNDDVGFRYVITGRPI